MHFLNLSLGARKQQKCVGNMVDIFTLSVQCFLWETLSLSEQLMCITALSAALLYVTLELK